MEMDLLSREAIINLMDQRERNSVSIYLPTIRVGQDVLQNPIKLKNLIDQAEVKLRQRGLGIGEANELLQPVRNLIDEKGDFWQGMSDGLAIFRSQDFFQTYRPPITFDEVAVVNDRFYIKPLIPTLEGNGNFYILALSINQVRLLQGDRFRIREVDLGETPTNMDEALGYDNIQHSLQYHTGTAQNPHGERNAMFFGYGGTTESQKKEEILRFFQILDRGVHKKIGDESLPLVLAGVEYLLPIYREVNKYPHLYDETISGNPDDIKPDQLRRQAWELVAPFYQQARAGIIDAYHILAKDQKTSKDIQQIVPAAFFGQVDALLVTLGQRIWGKFNPESYKVEIHERQQPGDEDLTDLATAFSLKNNGTVYTFDPVEMPDGATVAATLRYPLKGLDYNGNKS